MKIQIIHAGEFKEKYLREAAAEYTKRIAPMAEISDVFVKERIINTPTEIEKALEDEGREILSKIDDRAFVIALCVEGQGLSSEELAKTLEKSTVMSYPSTSFIIGSSHGLSESVKKRANLRLSFSKMTFPHQLMRVILLEQIYRALTILKGTTYHK